MPTRQINLSEHLPSYDLQLTKEEVSELASSHFVSIAPGTAADSWTLRAKQFVGVLQIGSTELRIHPKLSVGNVLFLLAYAHDQSGWDDLLTTLMPSDDLVTAIAV